jgi:hypothetical protein
MTDMKNECDNERRKRGITYTWKEKEGKQKKIAL